MPRSKIDKKSATFETLNFFINFKSFVDSKALNTCGSSRPKLVVYPLALSCHAVQVWSSLARAVASVQSKS